MAVAHTRCACMRTLPVPVITGACDIGSTPQLPVIAQTQHPADAKHLYQNANCRYCTAECTSLQIVLMLQPLLSSVCRVSDTTSGTLLSVRAVYDSGARVACRSACSASAESCCRVMSGVEPKQCAYRTCKGCMSYVTLSDTLSPEGVAH
eukprot:6526-Heterococcus_DN1.PRE.1